MGWFTRKKRKTEENIHDRVLLNFGKGLPFDVRMATEGVFVCAELGWGKTLLVFEFFLQAYLRMMGGWILGAKAEDLAQVKRLFEKEKALDRLTIIRPGGPHRVNWFSALAKAAPRGAITEEIVGGLSSLMELEQRGQGAAKGEEGNFFKTHTMLLLSAIVTVLRMAEEPLTAINIYRFLMSLPLTQEDIQSDEWQEKSYANGCMLKAYMADLTEEYPGDFHQAKLYLYVELVELNSRTRSSIVSSASAMLSKMLRGWMREMWSTDTTVELEQAFAGHWFYFDTSPLEFGEYGVSSHVMAKHLVQRIVMRRPIDSRSRPVALEFDEAQAVFVSGDRDFQAVCRSKLCCTWVATQNLAGLHAVLGGGPAAESVVKSWLALFGCKLFGANSDWDTNTYASQLCGQSLQEFASWNMNNGNQSTAWDRLWGNFDVSTGMSERFEAAVRPETFVRLRKPKPPRYEADAIVVAARFQALINQHWKLLTFRPLQ